MSNQAIQQPSRPVNSSRPGILYLVSCTKSKHSTAMEARDLYTASTRFSNSRCIVESTGKPWFILSAKHGLLSPEKHIKPYDKAMSQLSESERQQWAQDVISALDQFLDGVDRVCFLTEKDYYELLLDPLKERGIATKTPLANLDENELKQWLKDCCEEIQSGGIAWKQPSLNS